MTSTTQQKMFDKAVKGLASQKFKRCEDVFSCLYSNRTGTKHCAVGWLLPKAVAKKHARAGSVPNLIGKLRGDGRSKLADMLEREVDFLDKLQNVHDTSYDNLRNDLRDFAERQGLKLPKVLRD